jgi:hypothetical protein
MSVHSLYEADINFDMQIGGESSKSLFLLLLYFLLGIFNDDRSLF